MEVIFAQQKWKHKGCVFLSKKAGFSPWGPEPNRCYVTDTSHPDVELTRKFTGGDSGPVCEHGIWDHFSGASAERSRSILKKIGPQS